MLVVNFYGGTGSGKSTMAARVFSELKEKGINAELVTEYAKDLTWAESTKTLGNQIYVFGKQHNRLWRLKDSVDVVVTDATLLHSLIYGEEEGTFAELVMEETDKFNNLDIFLQRVKSYNPKGRSQTEDEAKALDRRIHEVIQRAGYSFDLEVPGWKESTNIIVKLIEESYVSTKSN